MAANKQIRCTAALALRLKKARMRSFALLNILGVIFLLPIIIEAAFLIVMEHMGLINPALHALTSLSPIVYVSAVGRLILSLLMLTPLSYGVKLWHYEISAGNPHPIYEAFGFYTRLSLYFKVILLRVLIFFRRTAAVLTLSLPAAMILLTLELVKEGSQNSGELLALTACIIIIGIVMTLFAAIFCMRYFLAPYILVRNPDIGVHSAITASVKAMRGRKAQAFTFMIALFIRLPLCVFIIPAFFILPHIAASTALYAMCLIEEQDQPQRVTAKSDQRSKAIGATQVFNSVYSTNQSNY